MYYNATRRTPTLDDPLRAGLIGTGWEENTTAPGDTCAFKGGAYHVSQANINYFQACTGPDFSNFVFEVQMKIIKGDAGGVILRDNTESNVFYIFVVGQDGTYQLFLCAINDCNNTIRSGTSSAIKQGLNQTNLIAVIAQGSTIGLYVNHQLIDSVNDNTNNSSGLIGVIAYPSTSNGNPTEVVYSNAKVWTI